MEELNKAKVGVKTRFASEIEDFDLKDFSEASPKEIPDGLPYSYVGALPSFLESETEYGSRWTSHIRHCSDAIQKPLPEGIEFGVTYVNWQGGRYKQMEGVSGERKEWVKVETPPAADTTP